MWCGVFSARAGILIVVVLTAIPGQACRRNEEAPIPRYIADHLEAARQKGQSFITINIPEEDSHTNVPLAFALAEFSLLSAEATGRSVVALHQYGIQTWHIFRPMEMISRATQRRDPCMTTVPPAAALHDPEVAFPFFGGSMTLRGVRLTITGSDSDIVFRPGARFLVFVIECGDHVFVPSFGTKGLVPLGDDRRIRVNLPKAELPRFARELLEVGSIDEFRRREQELKRWPPVEPFVR